MKPCWKRWRRHSARSLLLTPQDGWVIAATSSRFSTYEYRSKGSLLTRGNSRGPMAARRFRHDQTIARRSRFRPARRLLC